MFSPPSQLLETGRPPRGELSGMQQIVPGMFSRDFGVGRVFQVLHVLPCGKELDLGVLVEMHNDEQSKPFVDWDPRDVLAANVETQLSLPG